MSREVTSLNERSRRHATVSSSSRIVARTILVMCAGAIASAVGGCGGGSAPAGGGNTIVFGQTAPHSGASALLGDTTNGIKAYFAKVNAAGGVNGKKLKLVALDDAYDPTKTLQNVRTLVSKYHVLAEVGPVGTPTTAAAMTAATATNLPIVAPQTGAVTLYDAAQKAANLFMSFPVYTIDGETLGNFAKQLKLSRVGVLYQNDDFGKSILQGVEAAGVHPAVSIPYNPTQTDFSPAAAEFKAAKIDGIISITLVGNTIKFLQALDALNFKPKLLLSQSSATPAVFSSIGPSIEGAYISAFIPPLQDVSQAQVKDFDDAMGKYQPRADKGIYAAWGWLSAQIAVEGLRQLDGEPTADNYEQALEAIRNLETIGGRVSYSSKDHGGLERMFMVRVRSGKLVNVGG